MRTGGVCAAALLFLATLVLQVSTAEDIYWEGEDGEESEFLEVKEESPFSHITRLKRDLTSWWYDPFGLSSTSTTVAPENYEANTEDQDETGDTNDYDGHADGSGAAPDRTEPEPGEKTLRVSFVVMEPFLDDYSNRDSELFQTFSHNLANAVNELFQDLPGTQKASLVRIQTRLADSMSCKVTLDIVTTVDNTEQIGRLLREHIRNTRSLGDYVLTDADFSANVVNPGSPFEKCQSYELQCNDGSCVPGSALCNGRRDCSDGADESDCPSYENENGDDSINQVETGNNPSPTPRCSNPIPCASSAVTICPDQRCNGENDCPGGEDEDPRVCEPTAAPERGDQTLQTTPYPVEDTTRIMLPLPDEACPAGEFRCDETRCIPLDKVCDREPDCSDGTDEANCKPESCGIDDFVCNNGNCLESSKRCDRKFDCPDREDEYDCECTSDEFRCNYDGSCIEIRKRCDGEPHCRDGSDEADCACTPNQWQCDQGNCIKRSKRCNGHVDCPSDRSDERNCVAHGYFKCQTGKVIPDSMRCNRRYDCPPGDYSDEQNCPCGDDDFKCNNGHCIQAYKRCDRTHDCQDGSDELHCRYGSDCMAYEYKCTSGQCVHAESLCNGTVECSDGSDESKCPCKRGQFRCRDGSCINIVLRCDTHRDCSQGEDELNCGPCPPDAYACPANSRVQCATRCDDRKECDNGEDEEDCIDDECPHECDGRCLDANSICDRVPDCSDGSDEAQCDHCDRPEDFRCDNGECIMRSGLCNEVPECSDASDEQHCNDTMTPTRDDCLEGQFRCRDGTCLNNEFLCDGRQDCVDNSDEDSCQTYSQGSRLGPSAPRTERPRTRRYNPYGAQPGSGYPYSTNRPESNYPYGYDRPGSNDPYSTKRPESNYPYGYDRPGSNDPYTTRRPESNYPYGYDRPGSNDPYSTKRPESNYPYGYDRPESSGQNGPTQPETNDIYGIPDSGSNAGYPGADNQSGGDRYPSSPSGGSSGYPEGASVPCKSYEWRCENGPCIDARRRCDGHIDCPFDYSDEFDCPSGSPITLNVKTYPEEQSIRFGGDVVFQCRDEGPLRAPVRWVREGGRSLKKGYSDKNGRLELYNVTMGDSGVYICQTPKYLGQPGSEVRVTLTVDRPQNPITRPPFVPCKPHEATCGNGECIPKSAVCDGKPDCSDRSDEDTCNYNGMCEPNQFQCENRKCVLKSWLCDSDDDCGDGSDEKSCPEEDPNATCLPMEFACRTQSQCVPKSFHCDGRSDCFDGSDEIGCSPVYITKPPYPANVKLNPGDTLSLTCQAVGVPEPIISWRLNWGHVPPKCTWTNVAGVGNLTCHNMMPEDSGAYSCEAINNKGTTFANPDSIVFVSRTDPCPDGYFNNEARSQSECIRCFCFGKSTRCHSADLFTYNMPTPLGEGGTRLLGVALSGDGQVRTDPSIINHYYYQSLRNGATVTKLESRDDNWLGNFHPFLTLPETYNGNQLTSYGGHIKYTVRAHTYAVQQEDEIPAIIVKGKYATLYHVPREDITSPESSVLARFVPEYWEKSGPNGNLIPSTREDIMMALDAVDMILLRADSNNAGVNITNFVMESAQHINSGLGAASLVEECTCPEGYDGLSCQKCKPGYVRENSGPWLGPCVRKACPPGTYGDPAMGNACKPCPCPLTNKDNQFATTCSLGSDGSVTCDCFSGYEGKTCEKCAAGFEGNPLVIGDKCHVRPSHNCNSIGTRHEQLLDECVCKDNVQGRYCDHCKNDSFYLSNDFRHGCALCFCSGESQQCMSSNLRRKTTAINFNVPAIVDQVKVYNTQPQGGDNFRYTAPVETSLKPTLTRGGLGLSGLDRSRPTVYYWSMPLSFAGDKVTSYGGYLRYTLDNVPSYVDPRLKNRAADVQLLSDNHLTFQYFGNFETSYEGVLNVSVQLLEKGWQRPDGQEVPREYFLLALADVKTILIKATYSTDAIATPLYASIDTADSDGDGPAALHVEQCVCPPGYIGTSCEDCAPGYTRGNGGLYLAHCEVCQCNGHSRNCHPETGQCYECTDNTDGPRCELCKEGYERNGYDTCIAIENPTTYVPCRCDPRGEAEPCDEDNACTCKRNVDGENCDRCRPGFFGLDAANPDGCIACFCSGATNDCQEANHYYRDVVPAPIFGDNYGGYTIMDINAETVINDQFVPVPDKSELMYIFSFPPDKDYYWSLPVFPGNRVLSYGGSLALRQEFKSNDDYNVVSQSGNDVILIGDDVSVSWQNPNTLRSGESLSYQVPLREEGWTLLNSAVPADRSDFMHVLKSLRRVLVKATLSENILSTSIADVSMDTATEQPQLNAQIARGVEICMCPPGHLGTSCETCAAGYYKNEQEYCVQCPCNGHDCQLDTNGQVVCNCRPPYTGRDCSTIGLLMELHPTIRDDYEHLIKLVTLTCKYRAPEPLTIKFVAEGQDYGPVKLANESTLHTDGWHGEHSMQTLWDTRQDGKIYECHTITQRGSTLGVLFTDMRQSALEGGGQPQVTTSRPPVVQPTVTVRITSPYIMIQEVGSTVNFTCEAQSPYTRRLVKSWSKVDGELPQGRTFIDQYTGLLRITNVQITDSGQYICQTSDGRSTNYDTATLKVPANQMVLPSVEIRPPVKEYYAGDRVELECIAGGSPRPTISWQRASGRPLPMNSEHYEQRFIIDNAREEDSGEYRCIAMNTAGSADGTAVINVRPRPARPPRDRLVVQPTAATVNEGQSISVVCTGSTNVPTGTIDWVRQDGDRFQANVRSDNGVLYIDVATLINAGVYVCQTHGSDVAPEPVLVTVVTTAPPSPDQEPEVTVPVKSLRIPSGGSGKVDCFPSGQPLPLVKWTKYENEFGRGVSQRGDSLIINEAEESDAGYYMCQALDRRDSHVITSVFVYLEIEKREKPVVEVWPRGEQPVALGNTQFEFHCRVLAGIPPPVVSWSRAGGRPLSPDVHIIPNNILKFDKIEVNDEGEYICTGDNPVGSSSASSVIKVRSPPEIVITPRNYVEVTEGEPISVDCRAEGYPEPWITIRGADGREVSSKSRIATLRVASASARDDGTYACIATNPAGTMEDSFVIRVETRGDGGYDYGGSGDIDIGTSQPEPNPNPNPYPYPSPDQPRPQNPSRPEAQTVFEGQELNIYCNVTNGYDPTWDRGDRQPLQRNAQQFGNQLIIQNVSKSDSGEYVCSAYNYETREVQVALTTTINVVSMPKITLRPPTQTVHPGHSPTVECVVQGDDILDIVWRPTYKPFSSRVKVRNTTLIFQQIEVEDAGKYECVARNMWANASATAEVIVVEESDVAGRESHAHEQWVHAGAGVVLSCNVSGTGAGAAVSWTKDGRRVPKNIRTNRDGSLFIKLARASHSGYYVCHVRDSRGRQTSNFINLHIEGVECLDTEFRCNEDGSCIDEYLVCDGVEDCSDRSDEENCLLRDKRYSQSAGAPEEPLVKIDQPRGAFRVGENVEVVCTSTSRDVTVQWIKTDERGNRQHVDFNTFGGGSMLVIVGVAEQDAGIYQCVGRNRYGQNYTENFQLDIVPGSGLTNPRERNVPVREYSAALRSSVDMPCNHDLEEPVTIQWRREYTALPTDARPNQPILHIGSVTEGDAGTYVCRASNRRTGIETKAILRVVGVVPRFDGDSWVALPTLKDAYRQFDIEISFKPTDADGLIFYNSQNAGRVTDFLALQLKQGVPEFILETGSGPVSVRGDRPLALNQWHTIRLIKIGSKVTMDVDNDGPFVVDTTENWVLELRQPLYIGGVPDYNQLPAQIDSAIGFAGCVSMLVLGQAEKNIMMDQLDQYRVATCDTCAGNLCQNGSICQEARNERGYVCICDKEMAGPNCDRHGEACRPGLCGTGKCTDTADGYKCACPVTHTGRNCETRQQIEYPAFTGSAYLALKPPNTFRYLKMSMKVKASAPVTDGIIMYCAESPRGHGGFTSLAVKNQRLEFRYDLGEGNPVVLVSNTTLPANDWTDVQVTRSGPTVSLNINLVHIYEQRLDSTRSLKLETPMFIGGVDENIVLNSNTGVSSGFMGCIKDLKTYGISVDIVNDPNVESSNVQECSNFPDRGDIPETDNSQCRCNNGGTCAPDGSCVCPAGFSGYYCETRLASSLRQPARPPVEPCAARPCRNGGICRPDYSNMMNHTCDCPLGFAGASCQMRLDLYQSVGFNGNGYLELPANLVNYEDLEREPAVIALRLYTVQDGVLVFQREALAPPDTGDYLMIRIERGYVMVEWDMGAGVSTLTVNSADGKGGFVTDGEMHRIVLKLLPEGRLELSVDGITEQALTNGLSNRLNADSNIYIGGMPTRLNVNGYSGLIGCIDQVEFMDTGRGVNLGITAVTGRNTQLCKNNMFLELYPYLEEVEVFESPPPGFFQNDKHADANVLIRFEAYPIILLPIILYLIQNNAYY